MRRTWMFTAAVALLMPIMVLAGDMRYQNGNRLMKEGKYEEALKRFVSLVEEFPDVYQYRLKLGQCLVRVKQYDEAISHLKHAYELKSDSVPVILAYAQVLQIQGDYAEMARLMKDVDVTGISGALREKVYYLRGIARFYEKDYTGAAEDLAAVSDGTYRTSSAYYLAFALYKSGRLTEALAAIDDVPDARRMDALALAHKIHRTRLLEQSDPDLRKEILEQAIQVARELVRIDPSPDNEYALGQDALLMGDIDTSRMHLEKAAKGGNGYASYYLGFAYIRDGDLTTAEASFRRAEPILKQAGDNRALNKLYCGLGHIYHVRDEFERAIQYYSMGQCSKELELARQGKKALKQDEDLRRLINEYNKYRP